MIPATKAIFNVCMMRVVLMDLVLEGGLRECWRDSEKKDVERKIQ